MLSKWGSTIYIPFTIKYHKPHETLSKYISGSLLFFLGILLFSNCKSRVSVETLEPKITNAEHFADSILKTLSLEEKNRATPWNGGWGQ